MPNADKLIFKHNIYIYMYVIPHICPPPEEMYLIQWEQGSNGKFIQSRIYQEWLFKATIL